MPVSAPPRSVRCRCSVRTFGRARASARRGRDISGVRRVGDEAGASRSPMWPPKMRATVLRATTRSGGRGTAWSSSTGTPTLRSGCAATVRHRPRPADRRHHPVDSGGQHDQPTSVRQTTETSPLGTTERGGAGSTSPSADGTAVSFVRGPHGFHAHDSRNSISARSLRRRRGITPSSASRCGLVTTTEASAESFRRAVPWASAYSAGRRQRTRRAEVQPRCQCSGARSSRGRRVIRC